LVVDWCFGYWLLIGALGIVFFIDVMGIFQ